MIPPLPGERAGVRTVVQSIVPTLLAWFSTNARDLPWRRTRNPYAIWVSEIMLQQTQVKTVIPYWERWLRELPTIQAAAKTSPTKLHKLWEGLGYYTRVRNLRKAAQQIISQHDGKFPEAFDDVLGLPGIGRYTAGAVCSIAFNQPTPILDGNIIRVLTRIFGITANPREKQTRAKLWQLAEEFVTNAARLNSSHRSRRAAAHAKIRNPKSDIRNGQSLLPSAATDTDSCSHLNQSLMELGALVCTPRSPQCAACPVQKLCIARKENLQKQLPNLGKRANTTARRFMAFVLERDAKFLVRQRPAGVVNAHLWEFPNVEVGARVCAPQQDELPKRPPVARVPKRTEVPRLTAARSAAFRELGFRPATIKPLHVIKHSITRYRITLEAYRTGFAHSGLQPAGQWFALAQLHKLAFTSAHKKILSRLGKAIPKSARFPELPPAPNRIGIQRS